MRKYFMFLIPAAVFHGIVPCVAIRSSAEKKGTDNQKQLRREKEVQECDATKA